MLTRQEPPFGIVYLAKNRFNGKVYVGQTTSTLAKRWAGHKCSARLPDTIFLHALAAKGEDTFELVEIDRADSQEELDYMERYWIKQYRATERDFGYNQKDGGAHGKHSPESRQRMSVARKGQHRSPSTEFKPGMVPHNKGKHHSPETCAKMSTSQKRSFAEGRVHWKKGSVGTLLLKRRRPIMCVETGERFDGIVTAAQQIASVRNITTKSAESMLDSALNRTRKDGSPCTAYGQHWCRVGSSVSE